MPEMGTETKYIVLIINHNVTLVSEAPNATAAKDDFPHVEERIVPLISDKCLFGTIYS